MYSCHPPVVSQVRGHDPCELVYGENKQTTHLREDLGAERGARDVEQIVAELGGVCLIVRGALDQRHLGHLARLCNRHARRVSESARCVLALVNGEWDTGVPELAAPG